MDALRSFTGAEPKPITPSLEDVFIALARRSRAGAGAGSGAKE